MGRLYNAFDTPDRWFDPLMPWLGFTWQPNTKACEVCHGFVRSIYESPGAPCADHCIRGRVFIHEQWVWWWTAGDRLLRDGGQDDELYDDLRGCAFSISVTAAVLLFSAVLVACVVGLGISAGPPPAVEMIECKCPPGCTP